MPELSIDRPALAEAPARGTHPKAQLVTESGTVLTLPYAPRGASLGGWADPFSTQDRPGRKPLVTRDGDGLATMGITITLAKLDHQATIEAELALLRTIAASGERITVVNLSPSEAGPWRLADLGIEAELRQHGTNNITTATVSLSLIEASDAAPTLGPVSGGVYVPPKPPKSSPGAVSGLKRTIKYKVRKGDTVRKLAIRFYGEPEWQRIAIRNKLKRKNGYKLKVGRIIYIPPDDKD